MYLNYGTWDDFESVTSSQDLEGKVALVRSGIISLEQKVCSLFLSYYCHFCGCEDFDKCFDK